MTTGRTVTQSRLQPPESRRPHRILPPRTALPSGQPRSPDKVGQPPRGCMGVGFMHLQRLKCQGLVLAWSWLAGLCGFGRRAGLGLVREVCRWRRADGGGPGPEAKGAASGRGGVRSGCGPDADRQVTAGQHQVGVPVAAGPAGRRRRSAGLERTGRQPLRGMSFLLHRLGCSPQVPVHRPSAPGMACPKAGQPGRFFHRLHAHRRRKPSRPSPGASRLADRDPPARLRPPTAPPSRAPGPAPKTAPATTPPPPSTNSSR